MSSPRHDLSRFTELVTSLDDQVQEVSCLKIDSELMQTFDANTSGSSPNIFLNLLRQWFVHRLEVDRGLPEENQQRLEIDIELETIQKRVPTSESFSALLLVLFPEVRMLTVGLLSPRIGSAQHPFLNGLP